MKLNSSVSALGEIFPKTGLLPSGFDKSISFQEEMVEKRLAHQDSMVERIDKKPRASIASLVDCAMRGAYFLTKDVQKATEITIAIVGIAEAIVAERPKVKGAGSRSNNKKDHPSLDLDSRIYTTQTELYRAIEVAKAMEEWAPPIVLTKLDEALKLLKESATLFEIRHQELDSRSYLAQTYSLSLREHVDEAKATEIVNKLIEALATDGYSVSCPKYKWKDFVQKKLEKLQQQEPLIVEISETTPDFPGGKRKLEATINGKKTSKIKAFRSVDT
jgi:hypothetical protein